MKKLLSITAISLLLSGCFSSVDLPNSNSYSSPNIQLSSNESGFLGTHLAIASACIGSRAKTADKWSDLKKDFAAFVQQIDDNSRESVISRFANYFSFYMKERHIPLTVENAIQLSQHTVTDRKLDYDIAQAFLKQKPSKMNPCGTVNEVKIAFKQLVASKMH